MKKAMVFACILPIAVLGAEFGAKQCKNLVEAELFFKILSDTCHYKRDLSRHIQEEIDTECKGKVTKEEFGLVSFAVIGQAKSDIMYEGKEAFCKKHWSRFDGLYLDLVGKDQFDFTIEKK